MKKYILLGLLCFGNLISFAQQFNPDSSQVYFINNISNSSSGVDAFEDGNNGSYVFWLDGRGSSNKTAIYFQHLSKFGVPLYAQNGKQLVSAFSATSYFTGYKVIKAQNGFVVSWTTNTDSLFCNYFSFTGSALWMQPTIIATKGVSMIYISNNGMNIMPTDSGFFINYSIIYTGGSEGFAFNRVDFNGNLRWPKNYFQVTSSGYYWVTASDKHNGFYYAVSTGGLGAHIYVQHFNLQGVKSYPTNKDISITAGGRGNSSWRIVCDDDTNAYVVWESNTANKIVISKITPNNGLAWSPDYRSICSFSGTQTDPSILFSDNSIYSVWNDGRAPASNYFIYAQRTDTAGNMLWRQDGDSICRLGSYIPAPKITKNASGELVSTFLMGNSFLAQRVDTLANHKWKANGRAISYSSTDRPFYGDYDLVSNPDSSTTVYWISIGTKKLCAAKLNYYGNLQNAMPLPNGASAITGNDTLCMGASNVVYTTTAIANASEYHWQLPSGVTSASGSDTTLIPSISLNFSAGITTATIQVIGNNNLGDGAVSPDFTISLIPLPNAATPISGLDSAASCINQNGFTYTISPIANASNYVWTLPALASIQGNSDTTTVLVNYSPYSSSGNITVAGINSCGVGNSASLTINFKPIPVAEICSASIDSLSQKIYIAWQKPLETYVDGYVIYREIAGIYSAIDTVSNALFSDYLDTGSHPELRAEKYKLAVLDTCGNTGDISYSFNHQTIRLYGSIQPSGIAKLYWNDYIGINDPLRSFSLLRDTIGSGPFNDTLAKNISPSNYMNFSDASSFNFPLCRYVVEMVYNSNCTPGFRTLLNKSTSRSNIKNKTALFDSTSVGIINELKNAQLFSVYPNPAKNELTVQCFTDFGTLYIKDIFGRTISTKEIAGENSTPSIVKFDLSSIDGGIYFIHLESKLGNKMEKLILLKN